MQEHDESYNPEISRLEDDVNVHDGVKDRKFRVFESHLMTLFHRCHSCGQEQEVKLETSIVGILLVVSGTS